MAKRILVIDDDPQILSVASASLTLVGNWEVLTAGSGADGIAQAEAGRPEAILLDMMMPGMDGHATLRQLHSSPITADIPVIMLTAAAGPDVSEHAVTAVIPKPFDIMGLAGEVAAALGWDL